METNNYKCTQSELYTIAKRCWKSCLRYRPRFFSFKAKYTEENVTGNLEAVTVAQGLPDEMQRKLAFKLKSTLLSNSARSCRNLFHKLKRYIVDAYPKIDHKDYFDAAGQSYYQLASAKNWDAVQSLIFAAKSFATDNSTQLCNNDNMPVNFPSILNDQVTSFDNLLQDFLGNREESAVGTEVKIAANNALYEALMKMNLDAKEIFVDEPEIVKEFTFEHLLLLVRGAGTGGVRGTVTNSVTTVPVQDAIIVVGLNDYSTESDSEGKYEISPAASGIYSITVTADGYEQLAIPSHEIIVGTISSLNILLVPLP